MSRNTKIIFAILGSLFVLCLCMGGGVVIALRRMGQAITQSVHSDPTEAAQIADNIADYDLPPGYTQTAMHFFGFDWVLIDPADKRREVIMLMQFPKNSDLNTEQMQMQMEHAMESRGSRAGVVMSKVGEETVTIRGEAVELIIQEGNNASGETLRQMTGVFEGKAGTAMVLVTGPASNWDQQAVINFLHSIR